MDGLDAPPELPGEAEGGQPQPPVATTPQLPMQPSAAMLYSQPRSVFPGMPFEAGCYDDAVSVIPALLS